MKIRWMRWPRRASSSTVDAKFRSAPACRIEKTIFITPFARLRDDARLRDGNELQSRPFDLGERVLRARHVVWRPVTVRHLDRGNLRRHVSAEEDAIHAFGGD